MADPKEETERLVEAMPADLRPLNAEELVGKGLAKKDPPDKFRPFLEGITRAIPLWYLFYHHKEALLRKDGQTLTARDFCLSSQVDAPGVFISHVWKSDAVATSRALRIQALFFSMWRALSPMIAAAVFIFWVCPVALAGFSFFPIIPWLLLWTTHPLVLKFFGWQVPRFWFDKACVHQKDNSLKQAGLACFDRYLRLSTELWILLTPEYFSRIWCVYELSAWLHLKPQAPIVVLPLDGQKFLWESVIYRAPHAIALSLVSISIVIMAAVQLQLPLLAVWKPTMVELAGVALGLGFACIGPWLFYIFTPLLQGIRKGRIDTAEQMQNFDVKKCVATNSEDIDFVKKRIEDMHGSLDEFNKLVSQQAPRVSAIIRHQELNLLAMATFSCFMCSGAAFLCLLLILENVHAVFWPAMIRDLVEWLAPENCILSATPEWCAGGYHAIVRSEPCVNGSIEDTPHGSGCAYIWKSWHLGLAWAVAVLFWALTAAAATVAKKWGKVLLEDGCERRPLRFAGKLRSQRQQSHVAPHHSKDPIREPLLDAA